MSRPMSACGTRRPTMVVPEPATPHVLRLTRPPSLAPLTTLSHSPTEDDGFWAIDEDLASAQRRTGFFETAKNKLSEVIRTGRAPLVADLGLAYLEVDRLSGLAGDGMMTLAWTPFGDEAANEVFKALMAKAGANESAAACLERLLRRGAHSQSTPTKISFTSERVPYTLFIGGSTFTPSAFDPPDPIGRSSIGEQTTRLEQHNTRTHHVRSVSFFTVAGKPYHEPMVVCGSNMSITEGDTRTGDRDASSSKEASSLAAALPAPLFRRLIPDSVDEESPDRALFSTIASTLRSTLPLSDDTVYVRAGARALAETNPPVCVVAIHMVNHPQRRELFELARQHLTAARGEGGANEGIALHGTSLGAVAPICKRGFVVRERNHTQFGVGVYFSPVPRPFEPLEEDAGGGKAAKARPPRVPWATWAAWAAWGARVGCCARDAPRVSAAVQQQTTARTTRQVLATLLWRLTPCTPRPTRRGSSISCCVAFSAAPRRSCATAEGAATRSSSLRRTPSTLVWTSIR